MSRVETREGLRLTRRSVLGGALVLVCGAPRCTGAPEGGGTHIGPWDIPEGTKLSPTRYAVLCGAMDALIPGDASSPGATLAHAPWYLDQLLGAFDADPPRIYAGGPYSGRHGGRRGFPSFQPLTRVETIRWRTYIEGSQGIPEREFNGPVTGLIDRYTQGLDALDAAAQAGQGTGFALLGPTGRLNVLSAADPSFVQLVYEHAVEGTYGDPVYGGNAGRLGWKAIDYEGDRQPIGYTEHQMSHPEDG